MGDVDQMDEDGWLFFEYRMGGGIRKNGHFVNTASEKAQERFLVEAFEQEPSARHAAGDYDQ